MEELEVNHVDEIHQKLINMVGERIRVKANMGRTRVVERMGTIKTVHPSVFIVEVDERRGHHGPVPFLEDRRHGSAYRCRRALHWL